VLVRTTRLTPEAMQPSVRLGFIIAAHHQPEMGIRLVRRLYSPAHGFFRSVKCVFLKRQKCRWGDIGLVLAAWEGIQAIAAQGFLYDYALLLTGQDYRSNPTSKSGLPWRKPMKFRSWNPWRGRYLIGKKAGPSVASIISTFNCRSHTGRAGRMFFPGIPDEFAAGSQHPPTHADLCGLVAKTIPRYFEPE
jgi:hypothetical protein